MRTILLFVIAALGLFSCIKDRLPEPISTTPPVTGGTRKLIHYWTFNGATLTAPDTTIGGAAIVVGGTFDAVTPGTPLNARRDTASGAALRVRNPSTTMTLQVPTTGYKQPIVSFAVMRTGSGPQQNDLSYTLNGTDYTSTGITLATITISEAWTVFSFDFSAIPGADNNPNFAVRLTFTNGNTATSGNDRYDNIAVNAQPLTTVPPVVVSARKLVHYWTFNGATLIAPDTTIGGAAITVGGTFDAVTPGTSLNARRDTASGAAFRVRNPSTTMTLQLPTTGYKQPIVSFAAMRTTSGPQQNDLSYTLDGTNYINAGLAQTALTIGVAWTVFSFDFSAIPGANNNPNFAVRLTLSNGNTGTSGNDRYDNIAVEAFKI